jgi:quercetin dioxygenase-like cupin family protein
VAVLIDQASGSTQLLQRVFRTPPGQYVRLGHLSADDVVYVLQGVGELIQGPGDVRLELFPGVAFVVPPRAPATAAATADMDLILVSVLSPPPFGVNLAGYAPGKARVVSLHEDDQEDLPAGDDRRFRLLIEPRHGARNVTQFVGFIERSRAPFHTHTYEEAIYILEGEGIVHMNEDHVPIRTGTSIFLPPGTPHCLENAGRGTLKLLGVFSPPGSPADRVERPER